MSLVLYNRLERAPVRDPKYLAWIRTFPCIVCFSMRHAEPCHTPGEKGTSQKDNDRRTVPMCARHHREQHQKGWRRFLQKYDLDLEFWIDLLSTKPNIENVGGLWFATFTMPDAVYDSVLPLGRALDLKTIPSLRREWIVDYIVPGERERRKNLERPS